MHFLNLPKDGIPIQSGSETLIISQRRYRLDENSTCVNNWLARRCLRLISLRAERNIIEPHGDDYIAVITEDSLSTKNGSLCTNMFALGVPIQDLYPVVK